MPRLAQASGWRHSRKQSVKLNIIKEANEAPSLLSALLDDPPTGRAPCDHGSHNEMKATATTTKTSSDEEAKVGRGGGARVASQRAHRGAHEMSTFSCVASACQTRRTGGVSARVCVCLFVSVVFAAGELCALWDQREDAVASNWLNSKLCEREMNHEEENFATDAWRL